ncbi:MAG TPA: hypothetical protein VNR17_10245, partial [Luteimicrobium sp.]|nr:hypothetical protein [Luteimicrobium sp.]
AFRSALTQARDATDLSALLADAERFDDDTLRRAVLTVAVDDGQLGLVRRWTDRAGVTDQFEELVALREALAGRGMSALWDHKIFTPLGRPREAFDLPALEAADQASRQARAQARSTTYSGMGLRPGV